MADLNGDKTSTIQTEPSSSVDSNQRDVGVQSDTERNSEDNLPNGIKKRIGKLTKEKYELKTQYETLQSEFNSFRSQFTKPQEYSSDEERIQDLVSREIERREKERSEVETKKSKMQKYVDKYNSTDSYIADIDDFDELVNTTRIDLNDPVDSDIADFALNSESGKLLTYELAKNPDLLDSLRAMSNSVRAKTLIKLDDKLYAGISAKKAEQIVEDTIEDAERSSSVNKKSVPKFIQPVTGKSTLKGSKPLTMKEYMEQRNQRLAAKKGY